MLCKSCGAQNSDDNKFCTSCSTPLSSVFDDDEQSFSIAPAGGAPPTPYPPNTSRPNYTNNTYYTQQNYTRNNDDEHVSVGKWIGIFCLNLIPCVGGVIYLIMMFVWAFGSTPKKSLKTFARAQLLIAAIALGIAIVVLIIMAAVGFSLYDQSYYYW